MNFLLSVIREKKFHSRARSFLGRIIDENFENPKRGVQKLREKIETMTQLGKLDLLDNRTNEEFARLALNLHLVFKEPQDLCDPGSVLKRHGCGGCEKY